MERIGNKMRSSALRGKLNLRPLGDLHSRMVAAGMKGKYFIITSRQAAGIAFCLEQVPKGTKGSAKLQLEKGQNKDRGEIELPYEHLNTEGKRLYELLENCGRVYALDSNLYSEVIHVEWPTKAVALASTKSPKDKANA
jgi:hypothetical protein